MSRWRAAAIARLPSLRSEIASSDTVMYFWTNTLWWAFAKAYAEPRDEGTIAATYAFADWCMEAPRNDDLARDPMTAATVCFYEELPAFAPAREDLPRWISWSEATQARDTLAYMIGPEKVSELLRVIHGRRHEYRPRLRPSGRVY